MQAEITARHLRWTRAGLRALGIMLLFSVLILTTRMDRGGTEVTPAALSIALLFGLLVGAVALLDDRRASGLAGHLSLDDDGVSWRSARGKTTSFSYEALWFAGIEGRGRQERLVLRPRSGKEIRLRRENFAERAAPEALVAEILDRVEQRPGGAEQRAWLERRQAVAARLAAAPPIVAAAIAAVLAGVFPIEIAIGALGDPARLLALGASSPALVAEGEVYRIVTTNLLHVDWAHLGLNLAVLLWLSLLFEPLLGRSRFLTLFLFSALAGSAASATLGHYEWAVGASSGVYGLLGALPILAWGHGRQFPLRLGWESWLVPAFLWFFILMVDGTDVRAHLGAFVAGTLFAAVAAPRGDLSSLAFRHRRFYRTAALALVALVLAALTFVPLAQESLRTAFQP